MFGCTCLLCLVIYTVSSRRSQVFRLDCTRFSLQCLMGKVCFVLNILIWLLQLNNLMLLSDLIGFILFGGGGGGGIQEFSIHRYFSIKLNRMILYTVV